MTQPVVRNGAARVSHLSSLLPAGRGGGGGGGGVNEKVVSETSGLLGVRTTPRSKNVWLTNQKHSKSPLNEYIPSGGRGQGIGVHPLLRGTMETRSHPSPSLHNFSATHSSGGGAFGGTRAPPSRTAPNSQAQPRSGARARAERRAVRTRRSGADSSARGAQGGARGGRGASSRNPIDALKLQPSEHLRESNAEGVAWLADDIHELAVEAFRAVAQDAAQAARNQAAKFKPPQPTPNTNTDNISAIVKEIPKDHWAQPYMHAVSRALDTNPDANHHQKLAIINDTILALRTPNRFSDTPAET